MTQSQSDIFKFAEKLVKAGNSVIPIKQDSKTPAVKRWKPYQTRKPRESEGRQWWGNGSSLGIAVVNGAISGNRETIDIDEKNKLGLKKAFRENLKQLGGGHLLDKVVIVKTINDGEHLHYRCTEVSGSQVLAQKLVEDSTGEKKPENLIETRGEGAYTIGPPTPGYKVTNGDLSKLPLISPEERSLLFTAARMVNEYVKPERVVTGSSDKKSSGHRPGDDLNDKADWKEILEPHDWQLAYENNGIGYWQRPGKSDEGISATTNFAGSDLLYVFSTNAHPFEAHHAYDKFAAVTFLACDGDFSAAASALREQGYGGVPEIIVNNRALRNISDDAIGALHKANDPPSIFVRGGDLVRVRVNEKGQPIIEPLSEAALKGRLTRCADFLNVKKDEMKTHTSPPRDLVQDVLSIGAWQFPSLEAITETPVLRADGSILDTPGYDRETQLIYFPQKGFKLPEIPEKPTLQQRRKALALLDETIGDFPLVDEAAKATAFAEFLSPLLRELYRLSPLILNDAPEAGTGKGLLSEVTSYIATGRFGAVMTAPRTDDEWRKRITSLLQDGCTLIIVDNVEYPLGSASLSAVLTAEVWRDRLLGANRTITLPHRATWIATGNNIRLRGDLPRRCVWCRMDAKMARPWTRTGFKHPNLLEWVKEKRAELVAALLTLARAWICEGKPAPENLPVMGGFEDWSRTIGGILEVAGIEGFLGNLDEFYDKADEESAEWEEFLTTWHALYEGKTLTVKELAQRMLREKEGESAKPGKDQ